MGGAVGEAFSGVGVEDGFDALDRLTRELGEVAALGEILADQSVGVLVETPFPWMVGMRKIGLGLELFCQLRVAGELLAVVEGHRLHPVPAGPQTTQQALLDGVGIFVLHQSDPRVAALALHHRHQHGAAGAAQAGVHLSVPDAGTLGHVDRPHPASGPFPSPPRCASHLNPPFNFRLRRIGSVFGLEPEGRRLQPGVRRGG